MQMNVTLNPEDPLPLDPEDIMITDGTGAELHRQNIWVDDWLAALVNGVEALGRSEETFSAEVQSESDPIVFQWEGERFSLSFADTTVTGSLDEFRSDLKKAVQRMLAAFDPNVSFHPDSFWAQLQKFAS
jgi:hypothetical protein